MYEARCDTGLPAETSRLVFRRLDERDAPFVGDMLADPTHLRFCPKVYADLDARGWIRLQLERYERDGHGLWLALEKNGRPVGQVGLVQQCVDRATEVEVAFMIHAPHRRRGLATEAALVMRDHAFVHLGRHRVISLIHPDNRPSQGVALRLGMSLEGWTFFGQAEHLVFAVPRGAA
jgi:RimJ/RimL family protein N-acetyltransferase